MKLHTKALHLNEYGDIVIDVDSKDKITIDHEGNVYPVVLSQTSNKEYFLILNGVPDKWGSECSYHIRKEIANQLLAMGCCLTNTHR